MTATVLVIGDIILDEYLYGKSTRLSPEAPVPVVELTGDKTYRLGGAANVAANVAALGGNALLVGLTGQDAYGDILHEHLVKSGIGYRGHSRRLGERRTTVKTRVMVNHHQVCRLDQEDVYEVDSLFSKYLGDDIDEFGEQVDAIIISDYAKGVINKYVVGKAVTLAKMYSIPLYIDVKPKHVALFSDLEDVAFSLIAPNWKEACAMTGYPEHLRPDAISRSSMAVADVAERLVGLTHCTAAVITLGEEGMWVRHADKGYHIPTAAKQVFDVSGAGDTAIAALALYAYRKQMREAVHIANVAAGIAVGKEGTSVVTLIELKQALEGAVQTV